MLNDIRLGFSAFATYVALGGKINKTDINVTAENFVGNLLNMVNKWDLENTNKQTSNYPNLDLIDVDEKVGVQVTSEGGSDKVNDTIAGLAKAGAGKQISRLKVFLLTGRQTRYTIKYRCKGISFKEKTDVIDFATLMKEIEAIMSVNRLSAIHDFVTKSMPKFFGNASKRNEALCDQVRRNLTVFEREVMDAPFHSEEPVGMVRAVIEMRRQLQQGGARLIANDIAKANFTKARGVLQRAERAVREKFPDIYAAAVGDQSVNIHPNNKGYYEAIHLMMGIRPELTPLLDEIGRELSRLESL